MWGVHIFRRTSRFWPSPVRCSSSHEQTRIQRIMFRLAGPGGYHEYPILFVFIVVPRAHVSCCCMPPVCIAHHLSSSELHGSYLVAAAALQGVLFVTVTSGVLPHGCVRVCHHNEDSLHKFTPPCCSWYDTLPTNVSKRPRSYISGTYYSSSTQQFNINGTSSAAVRPQRAQPELLLAL